MTKIQKTNARGNDDNAEALQSVEDLAAACRMAMVNLEGIDFLAGGTRKDLMKIWQRQKQARKLAVDLAELAECMIISIRNLK